MIVVQLLLKAALCAIAVIFIVRVVGASGIRRTRQWIYLLVAGLSLQASFFLALIAVVFAGGGNHLDVMLLLSSSELAAPFARVIYVTGIFWEELTKLILLILILRCVPWKERCISTFLLAGVIFGGLEGLSTMAITLFAMASGADRSLSDQLMDTVTTLWSVLDVMLVHSVLGLVYGMTFSWAHSIWTRVLVPLMIATALHLAYNHFVATNPYSLEDGARVLIQPAGFLIGAMLVLFLRRIESDSPSWREASETLPFSGKVESEA